MCSVLLGSGGVLAASSTAGPGLEAAKMGWREEQLKKPRASRPRPFDLRPTDVPTYWWTDDDVGVLRKAGVTVGDDLKPGLASLEGVLIKTGLKYADLSVMSCEQIIRALNRAPKRKRTAPGALPHWLPQALKLKEQNPNWPDCKIAKEVGVSGATLSRNEKYQRCAASLRTTVRRGHRTLGRDGQSYTDGVTNSEEAEEG